MVRLKAAPTIAIHSRALAVALFARRAALRCAQESLLVEPREIGILLMSPVMRAETLEDENWMRQAIVEGRKAWPACAPNPPVGCVVVSEGQVVARGHTQPPGQPHAEAMALQMLMGAAAGATVYVTLEPCSFQGRTPSCAHALVAAGVGRVCVGVIDPHPRNRGRGIDILRAAGIPVELGILGRDIEDELSPYLVAE